VGWGGSVALRYIQLAGLHSMGGSAGESCKRSIFLATINKYYLENKPFFLVTVTIMMNCFWLSFQHS